MATTLLEKMRTFLNSQVCLIAETSPALAMSLRAKLVELGVPNTQIHTTSKFDGAKELLLSTQPNLFIADFEMEPNLMSGLIDLHEKMHEASARTIVVTSRHSSVAVLMEDRESQIDSFLVKPFSADSFRDRFVSVAITKVEPPPYVAKLNLGRTSLASGDTDEAMKQFEEASELTPKPTMAWYYKGQTSRKRGNQSQALECYREGLKVQPHHYKCTVAEFETLHEMGKLDEAFALIEPITAKFPVGDLRLRQFFELAVEVKRFDSLPTLYTIFRGLEERSKELVDSVETAFLDAGRFLLAAGDLEKALSFFETGIQVASQRFDYVERIVRELVDRKALQAAESALAKVAPGDRGSAAFEQLAFCVDRMTMGGEQLINRGRQLIFAGHGNPDIFHFVVRSCAEAGKETLAESAICKAIETYPELRESLYKLVAEHLPKRAA